MSTECEFCGNEISTGALACERCGTPVTKSRAKAGQSTGAEPPSPEMQIVQGGPGSRAHRNSRGYRKTTAMIVALLVAAGLIVLGVYVVSGRKKATLDTPAGALREFMRLACAADFSSLQKIAVPDAPLVDEVQQVLKPYEKLGILTLTKLDTRTISETGSSATIEIKKFEVEITSTDGGTEMLDMLSVEKPFKLPTRISLIKQQGKWVISS